VSRGLTKVFAILVATELVALAVVVAFFLHGSQRTEFPASVAVMQPVTEARSSVPVSVRVQVVGKTKTAALRPRGGAATATTDSGFVQNRRRPKLIARPRTATPPTTSELPTP
jgi:hypothetical protein